MPVRGGDRRSCSAGACGPAGQRLTAAAELAHARGDLAGEIGFLDRAVALLGDDGPAGAALLPALVSALFESGASDRAEALADRAVSVTGALGLDRVHARARIEREHIRLSCHPETFRPERSVAIATEAVATMRALGDELGLARAAYLMSDLAWLAGDTVASYAHAEEMLALARRAGSDFDAATALVFMSWCLVEGPWPAPEAIARCDALLRDAERAGRLSLLGCRAVLLVMVGRYEEARGEMRLARAGFADLRLDLMAAYLALLVALAEMLANDPGRGRTGGPRRRGDGLRARRPLVPGDGQRRPGAHGDRAGPARGRRGGGRADRRGARAL